MFFELVATLVAGLAGAGVMLILGKVLGARLPRWTVPAGAGLAMLATTIGNEYGWYPRTSANLAEGMIVAQTVENRSVYRPWTYLAPYVDRFVAVDRAAMRSNPGLPGQHMVDLYFFGRWAAVRKVPVLMDCQRARRALMTDDLTFDDSGAATNADWQPLAADDPVLQKVCEVS